MSFMAIGSAEAGDASAGGDVVSGSYTSSSLGTSIVTSPALSGSRSFQVDPVNGTPVVLTYGSMGLLNSPSFLTVMFMFKTPAATAYDDEVSICELGNKEVGGSFARQLDFVPSLGLKIFDKDLDQIDSTVAGYTKLNTVYYLLWYVDLRSPTRDILWVRKPAASLTDTSIAFVDGGAGADTITDSNSGFGIFTAGDIITVSGSTSNDGTYTIVSVVAGTITLATGVLTTEAAGANVTVAHASQWYKSMDVSGWGDGDPAEISAVIFGSFAGKTLPTAGDPFYVDDMAVEVNPNAATALGSAEVKYVVPTANGTDGDFDTGTGTNPDWNDVKEIPPDLTTSYDEGDVNGDQQSYAAANKGGGETVLTARATGAARESTGPGPPLPIVNIKAFLAESSGGYTRDYAGVDGRAITAWFCPAQRKHWESVNGSAVDDVFDSLEVGVEITGITNSAKLQVTQLGIEYLIAGPHALPDDFPTGVGSGRRIMVIS